MALLRNKDVHRSSQIGVGDETIIDCYHHFNIEEPNQLILPYLEQAGFANAAKLGRCKVDRSLVTAMVERWRDETHTFHLPTGECTITLEDVALQLGLRVDGIPVTGPSMLEWKVECRQLLGLVPPEDQRKGQAIKLKWLKDTFATVPQDATEEQIKAHCRAYILRLIGGVLIPDKSNNRVHLMYLPLLKDLERAGRYSWGSACLASLYREMCRATDPSYACMGGCTLLLQSWVWYRMPFLAPQCNRLPSFPLAKRWSGGELRYTGTPHGDIIGYRSRIDHMQINQFLWLPYRSLENCIPAEAFGDYRVWTANTALICFQIVEWHQTDRVKLQFGLWQEIPDAPRDMDALHKQDMRGNHSENWKDIHADWIQIWRERRRRVIEGQPIQGPVFPTEEYLGWLKQNSILYLSIQHQLQDPRGDFQQDPIVGPSMPTQRRERRNRRQQPSPAVAMEHQYQAESPHHSFAFTPSQQEFEPPRHSFAFTPTHQDALQNYDARRHSIASSDSDFMSNLFGVNMNTPDSVRYMDRLYSFGVPSLPNQAGASSSTVNFGELREPVTTLPPVNVDLNEVVQQDEEHAAVEEEQPTRHHSGRPRRNRRAPRCGTGHRLGH